jgi:predicted ATPase
VCHAVAQGLDVPLGRTDPVVQLGDAIAGRGPCLVILDNFEQVVDAAERSLGRWMERAPEARFLVTSRERLALRGDR